MLVFTAGPNYCFGGIMQPEASIITTFFQNEADGMSIAKLHPYTCTYIHTELGGNSKLFKH